MLSTLSWPKRVQDQFLADWRAGRHQLPQIEYRKFDFAARRHVLKNIAHQCDAAHPIGNYLQRTAHSWQVATLLLDHFLQASPGVAPGHFSFRAEAPLTDGAPFDLCFARDGDGARLWARDAAGRTTMRASLRA